MFFGLFPRRRSASFANNAKWNASRYVEYRILLTSACWLMLPRLFSPMTSYMHSGFFVEGLAIGLLSDDGNSFVFRGRRRHCLRKEQTRDASRIIYVCSVELEGSS